MKKLKIYFLFALFTFAASCIDPYIPNLKDYNSLLVIDGLITNENISNKIKLYRTTTREGSIPENINDASVFLTSGTGIRTDLQNYGNGTYLTDSTSFTGAIGEKYILHILTSDGKEYESGECTMMPEGGIDSLFYVKGEELSGDPQNLFTGIKILLNAKPSGMDQYIRWTFEETWKFKIPSPQQVTYGVYNDTTFNFEVIPVIQNVCWKMHKSGDVLTNYSGPADFIRNQEIRFIAPETSDRLTNQYSILVKQYSISKDEFQFWNNLKKSGNSGGDIFASQPYTVVSNIHNIDNQNELVLGYFQVSSVSEKRIYITNHELEPLNLTDYIYDCREIIKCPEDWPDRKNPWDPPLRPTWEGIYNMYTSSGENVFIRPEVQAGTISYGHVLKKNVTKFVFAPTICVQCAPSGQTQKPDYWIDME